MQHFYFVYKWWIQIISLCAITIKRLTVPSPLQKLKLYFPAWRGGHWPSKWHPCFLQKHEEDMNGVYMGPIAWDLAPCLAPPWVLNLQPLTLTLPTWVPHMLCIPTWLPSLLNWDATVTDCIFVHSNLYEYKN